MDIDQFYEADERRRESAEIELGTEWRDAHGVRYEVNWIEATAELYVMREPAPPMSEDPFGGVHVETGKGAPFTEITVAVVAHVSTRERLEEVLEGWQTSMPRPDSVSWLESRLKTAGVTDASWSGEA
ncbi:MAG: hypothetical protein ACRDVP_07735, partial [Acidimicrobiales bacterium]